MTALRSKLVGDGSEIAAIMARKSAPDPEIVAGFLSGDIVTTPARRLNRAQRRYEGRFTRRRYQRSPDREKSMERRRTLAATWPMPPKMCGKLTTSQAAYAKIVADEVARTGDCRLTLDEIAARGGMSRKTAKRAQDRLGAGNRSTHPDHKIEGLGWVTVEVREVKGRKNLPNVVRIVSVEWTTWIELGPRPRSQLPTGGHSILCDSQKRPATVNLFIPERENRKNRAAAPAVRPQEAVRGSAETRTGPPHT